MGEVCLNKSLCPQNHRCPAIRICPTDAISQDSPYSVPKIDKDKCIACGKCIKLCPTNALYMKIK